MGHRYLVDRDDNFDLARSLEQNHTTIEEATRSRLFSPKQWLFIFALIGVLIAGVGLTADLY